MTIKDFLQLPNKKILLANKVSVGNTLIRKANKEDGINTVDVTSKTVTQVALELVQAETALKGEYSGINQIGADSATLLLTNQVRENLPSFISKSSLSIATAKQLYKSISILRTYPHKEAYSKTPGNKIQELQKMIAEYEKLLFESKLYDNPRLLNEALRILNTFEKQTEVEGTTLDFYLPWLKGATIGCMETNRLTGLEEEFIDKLCALGQGTRKEEITFLPEGGFEAWKENNKVEKSFVKAYGAVNEIANVIETILALQKEKVNLDQINIFYSSTEYENFLRGALDMAHIPYHMDRGIKASGTGIVQMMLRMLDWAESDFNYEKLKPIILNRILTFDKIIGKGENETIYCNPNKEYINASSTIGWGADRYMEFCDRKEKKPEAEIYAQFLKDILNVFIQTSETGDLKERVSVVEIYEEILAFMHKYTMSTNREWQSVSNFLAEQLEVFKFLQSDNLEKAERLEYIRSFLANLMVPQVGVESPCVNVCHIDDFRVLERPYNFVIGMSATKFSTNSVNSAVLSDEDMKEYLEGTYIPFAGEADRLRSLKLQQTLSSLKEGSLCMSFSSFDTINLRDNCISVFMLDLCQDPSVCKTIDGYDCFGKDSKDFNLDDKTFREWLDKWTEKVRIEAEKREEEKKKLEKQEEKEEESSQAESVVENKKQDYRTLISASRLQHLLSCPLKYYYESIRKIKVDEPVRKLPYQWMPAVDRGNLYHRTYERFMKGFFPPTRAITTSWNDATDTAELRKIFDDVVLEIKKEIPPAPTYIMNKEIEENWNCALEYMKQLHNLWLEETSAGKGWQVLGCELDFKEDIVEEILYKDEDSDSDHPFILQFANGSIDRLDGYVDANNTLHLRIVDYKTGSVSNKIEEIESHVWIQHHVYAMGAIVYVNKPEVKADLCKQFGVKDITAVAFDSIVYSFPTSVLEVNHRNEMEVDVLLDAASCMGNDRALFNNMIDTKQLFQDEKNPMLWHVEFSDEVKEILRKTEGIRQKIAQERDLLSESDGMKNWHELLLDLEVESRYAIDSYINQKIADLREKNPWNKNKEKGGFCDYCNFKAICRNNAGEIPYTGKVSEEKITEGEADE